METAILIGTVALAFVVVALAIVVFLYLILNWLVARFCTVINEHEFQTSHDLQPPKCDDPEMRVRFIGTSGFVISSLNAADRLVIIDPYFTRPNVRKVVNSIVLGCPIAPNESIIEDEVEKILGSSMLPGGAPRSTDILIGHSHVDHILDAPYVCSYLAKKGVDTRFFGSDSAQKVAEAAFKHDGNQATTIICAEPNSQGTDPTDWSSFPVEIENSKSVFDHEHEYTPIRSLHGYTKYIAVPNPGFIDKVEHWPTNYKTLKHGTILNWLVRMGRQTVLHIGSANLIEEELEKKLDGQKVDLLCLCGASWNGPRPSGVDYIRRAIEIADPKYVTTCHWDWFCDPGTTKRRRLTPFLKLDEFFEELRTRWNEAGKPKENVFFMPFDSEFHF